MTCENCIHYEAYLRKERIVIDGINRAAQYASEFTNNKIKVGCSKRESICEHFADNSRFIELPCKVGDTIYEIVERKRSGKWIYKIVPRTVEQIEVWQNGIGFRCGTTIWVSDNLAFFTREEAEQALKERENNDKTDD